MDTTCTLCVIALLILNVAEISGQVAPVFLTDYPTAYTIPDTWGTNEFVALVVVSDTDAGMTFPSLTMGTNSYFVLTSTTVANGRVGTVSTHGTTSITAISGTTQTLTFVTVDSTSLTASTSYNITVENTSPTLTLPSTAVVSDSVTADTLVYTITCTDPSDTVTSSFVSVTPSNSPNAEFFFVQNIPTTSNYGVYARSQTDQSKGVFNYNRQISHVVKVQCTDGKTPVTGDVTVYVRQNHASVISNLPLGTSTSVATTVAAGHTVFTVTATDNENDAISFTAACNPTGCPLTLTSASSTTATLTTSVALSTLTSTSDLGYDVTITPLDAKNSGTARILTVLFTGTNNAPTFSNLNNAWTVNENTAVGTTVFTVSSADADGDTVTLSFTSVPTSGTTLFEMDTSGNVKVKSALDYESLTNKTYVLTVLATDTKTTSTATLSLLVADVNEPLTWNSANYRANVADGAAQGTTVTVTGLAVTDPDANETLTCTMSCVLAGYFSMSPTCAITVTSVYSLDQGLANTVTCLVNGTDNGETNTATTTLVLDIVDANNYTPCFLESGYMFDITPYEASGFTLGRVNATDADTGTFGTVAYSLNQTLTGTYFTIDSSTGIVSTVVSMDTCSCSGSTLAVPVYATDGGGLIGTSTVYVTLSVTSTTSTTTTTERPKTFLEDSKNTSWLAVLLATAAVAAIVTGYVLFNYVFGQSGKLLSKSTNKPTKSNPADETKTNTENKPAENSREGSSDRSRAQSNDKKLSPPKRLQGWRNEKFL